MPDGGHGDPARLPPEVLAGISALARVSRALVATGGLAELATRALTEMRDALGLELAALYLPAADGHPALERFVSAGATGSGLRAREEWSFERESWRLLVAGGVPIVFREPAGWLGPNPFEPAASHWLVLPLVSGQREMAGVVAAAAAQRIALDPVTAAVLVLLGGQLSAGITNAYLRRRLQRAEMERERRTLAAEVHDGLAQDLALAVRELAAIDDAESGAAAAQASRERLRDALASAHATVRSRLHDLAGEPPSAELPEALEDAVRPLRARGMTVTVALRGAPAAVEPRMVAVVARVVGEALNNVVKHAQARAVHVSADVHAGGVDIAVTDDGRGIDPAVAQVGGGNGHFGLTIMRERARAAGGVCRVERRPEGGTLVALHVPVAGPA